MIIKHSKLFKIYYLKNCGWDTIVEGTQTSGGARVQSAFVSLSCPHYCIRHCREMSLDSSHPSPALRQTDATPRPSVPTPGQETEAPDTETPGNYRRGSFHYDRVNGILPLEWPNLAAFDVWHRNEEMAPSIELIKSTIACGRQVWTLRRIFVCSREDGRGGTKYVKKLPEWKWKIPSKKTGCPCNIVIKRYPDTERILGCYERDHNHPIGITNVPFTRLSAGSRRRMRDMVSQKIDPREIVCKMILLVVYR